MIKSNICVISGIAADLIVLSVFLILLLLIVVSYEKKRTHLEKISMVDPLTGGDNNRAFQTKLGSLLLKSSAPAYTIVFLNIKGFKLINENYGIVAGDNTLKYIYKVLKNSIREDELVCRSEMDQFFLCLKENSQTKVEERLRNIINDVNSFNSYTDISYYLSMRLGGYFIDEPNLDIRTIQDRARFAGTHQREENACSFFGYALIEQMKKETQINTLFESSLKNQDFKVYLQPKVRLSDMKLCGAEALVRWEHPEYGLIYPSDFIPLFEKNDKICILDLYVFEEVCRLIRSDMDNGDKTVPISVNLSRSHTKNLNFLRDFIRIKKKYNIPDKMIEFEITESIMMNEKQINLTKNIVREMHKNGFLCSLDDFGFGYSSLALLKEFDIDVIKLDKSFFDDITNYKAREIIWGFIGISHKLGIEVVAEGIETEEQLDFLSQSDCDIVQGYIFSKPLTVLDFKKWSSTL